MEKCFVINFDEVIIFEKTKEGKNESFYNKEYDDFDNAKLDLVAYWENRIQDAKNNLLESKQKTLKQVQKLA